MERMENEGRESRSSKKAQRKGNGNMGGGEKEKWRLERRQVKWQETREGKNERGREKIGENDK